MAAIAGKIGAVFQTYSATDKSKLIADFQADETWVSGAGTQSTNTTTYRLGTQSLKILENDNTGSSLYSSQNSLSLNLATFQSGAASNTSDYIYGMVYVSDATKISSISIAFGADAIYSASNSYIYTISTGIVTGWNYFKIKKSAFTESGTIAWTSIQSICVQWVSTNNAQNAYVLWQALYLIDDAYDFALLNNTAYVLQQKGLFYSWSLSAKSDMYNSETLGDSWKEYTPGLKEYSVSCEDYWEDPGYDTNLGSTALAILLYTSTTTGYRYEGLMELSDYSVDTPVGDLIKDKLQLTGTGELYYTALQIKDT